MKRESVQNKPRGKLLLVAYDFPPVATAGIYRVVGMAKYLMRKNWDVTVLTVRRSFTYSHDDTLKLIPQGLKVVRTFSLDIGRVENWLLRKVEKGAPRESFPHETDDKRDLSPWRRGCVWFIRRLFHVIKSVTTFPDSKAGWFIPLIYKTWSLTAAESYDVVLSTSPPHSTQWGLCVLRQFKRFKWVVDFRDPWTTPDPRSIRGLSKTIQRQMEKQVLLHCDGVVANTHGNRGALTTAFGDIVKQKTTVITNGFDNEWACESETWHGQDLDCDLVYTGEIYPRMLWHYVEAMARLRSSRDGAVPRLWVFGNALPEVVKRQIVDNGLQGSIEFKGRLSFEDSLCVMSNAKALLYLLPHGSEYVSWIPSKLYPYLFSSAPILAVAPRGDAVRIVEATGRGVAVTSEDPDETAEAILDFMDRLKTSSLNLKLNEAELSKYRMDALADSMDSVLKKRVV